MAGNSFYFLLFIFYFPANPAHLCIKSGQFLSQKRTRNSIKKT